MTLPFPDSVLAQHIILLAKTRAGKSSVMRLIAEHLLDHKKPLCIIDPKGDWWGIKSSASGKRAGYPVVIFGGKHADVPISAHAGAQVAELIATGNRPALIDLSRPMSIKDRTRFFIDFAESFFTHSRGLRTLMIDEVHNFAPQGRVFDPQAGMMLNLANTLASEGGGKGITLVSASQRPQKVAKDYVTSHETLIAMRTIHPLDRAQIKDWIDGAPDKTMAAKVLDGLASLKRGQGWVWSPEVGFGPALIKFPLFSTYDSFKPQDHDVKLKGWASVDLDDVRTKLAAVLEEHKANDPTALRNRIRDLEQKIEDMPGGGDERFAYTAADITQAQQTGFDNGHQVATGAWKPLFDQAFERLSEFMRSAGTLHNMAKDAVGAFADVQVAAPTAARAVAPVRPVPPRASPRPPAPAPGAAKPPADGEELSGSDLQLLGALAYWAALGFDDPTRAQVAAVAGWRVTSGHLRNVCGSLRTRGMIEYPSKGTIMLTPSGAESAPAADTTRLAFDQLIGVVEGSQAMVLRELRKHGKMSRDDIAGACGWRPTSGHLRNVLGSLRTLQAIKYPEPGTVQLEQWLTR